MTRPPAALGEFQKKIESSWIKEELWKVRNLHQGFEHGMFAGMFHAGLQTITGGRGLRNRYPATARARADEEAQRLARSTAVQKLTCSVRPRAMASSPSTSSPIFITQARSMKRISLRTLSSTIRMSATNAA